MKEKVLAAHRNRMTDVLMPEMYQKAETILDALPILFPQKT